MSCILFCWLSTYLTQKRSANILLKSNIAKISDFNLSGILEKHYDNSSQKPFPTRYSAPEMVTGAMNGSIYTDVWSYGTLIYEVLTYGKEPFKQFKTDSDVSEKLTCKCCY